MTKRNKKGQFIKGNKSRLGKKHTKETKLKISKSRKGIPSAKGMLGKKMSEESKLKMSNSQKARFKRLGYINSPETRKKISESKKGKNNPMYGRLKEKSPLWKGGISFEKYTVKWTETLKRSIRERDKYTCAICDKEPSVQVHHIDYNKKNCNPDNLITLCRSCHSKTNFNRKFWTNYFNNL